jgi:STE24 endopeptidase
MNRSVVSQTVFLFALILPLNLKGQESPRPPPVAAIAAQAVASFDPAAATQAWLDTVPPDERAKSDAYFEGGYWLILWNFLLSSAISIVLLQSRISVRLRDLAEHITRFKTLQVVIYVIPYMIIVATLIFPLMVYQEFYREHKYGLATQSFGPWFYEQIEMFLIALIAAALALMILYAVFRRAPRTWWMWGAILAVCFSIFGTFITPVYIEPIFNTYKPLEDPAIRDPILALARANQIPVQQVFVVDASRQTTRVGANVAGLFGTTRIALNDNLLKQCTLSEIRQVMAHEIGHYVLNHGVKLVTYFGIFVLVGFALTRWLFNVAVRNWGNRWAVRGIGDPAGLPLLALIVGALSFLATPVTNTVTRVIEREADAFGINTSREPDGFAQVSLKLGQYRKLNPGPLEEFVFFDHPSGRARIRMAMDWKASQLPCGNR